MDLNIANVSLVLSLPVMFTVMAYLVKIIRMLSRLEMKMELLWDDYSERKKKDDDFRQTMIERRLNTR